MLHSGQLLQGGRRHSKASHQAWLWLLRRQLHMAVGRYSSCSPPRCTAHNVQPALSGAAAAAAAAAVAPAAAAATSSCWQVRHKLLSCWTRQEGSRLCRPSHSWQAQQGPCAQLQPAAMHSHSQQHRCPQGLLCLLRGCHAAVLCPREDRQPGFRTLHLHCRGQAARQLNWWVCC